VEAVGQGLMLIFEHFFGVHSHFSIILYTISHIDQFGAIHAACNLLALAAHSVQLAF
jgi:hypothetical protein